MIHDGRPSDWCKGKAVFENSKSRPSKIPARPPSMKGYPPNNTATTTPSYSVTYPHYTETSYHAQKNFSLRMKNEPVLVAEVTSTGQDAK